MQKSAKWVSTTRSKNAVVDEIHANNLGKQTTKPSCGNALHLTLSLSSMIYTARSVGRHRSPDVLCPHHSYIISDEKIKLVGTK